MLKEFKNMGQLRKYGCNKTDLGKCTCLMELHQCLLIDHFNILIRAPRILMCQCRGRTRPYILIEG